MKKFFLFLLATLPLSANAAQTSKFSVTENSELQLNGLSNFTAAARNQSNDYEHGTLDNGTDNRQTSTPAVENNSQLYLKLNSKKTFSSENQFGAVVKFESEVSSAQNKATINADQGFFYADSKDYGKIEVGDNIAVNQKMKVGPSSFIRGAGGINGNYLKYINLPTSSQFILIAQSPIGHGGQALSGNMINQNSILILRNGSFNGAEDASKISYYSPRIDGVQIGASYTPNTSSSVVSSTVFNGSQNAILDVVSAGINYSDTYDNFDYAFSATTEQGKSKSAAQNNLSSYDIATTMSYFGFTFGASYGSWQKSMQDPNQNFKNATYKTAGISYQIGHFSINLSTIKSSYQKNDYRATSLGLDYKLSRVFMPYFEITNFALKSNQSQTIANNKGMVALAGFVVTF